MEGARRGVEGQSGRDGGGGELTRRRRSRAETPKVNPKRRIEFFSSHLKRANKRETRETSCNLYFYVRLKMTTALARSPRPHFVTRDNGPIRTDTARADDDTGRRTSDDDVVVGFHRPCGAAGRLDV